MKNNRQQLKAIRLFMVYFFTLTLTSNIVAQTSEPCGFEEGIEIITLEDPNYQNQIDAFNLDMLNNPGQGAAMTDDYIIPTVVHIIHNGGVENISDDQVIAAIQQTNQQLSGLGGGIDTEISLKLAAIDPYGNCTSGINRVPSTFTDVQTLSYWDQVDLKNLSRWDPYNYLNIWIVKSLPGNLIGKSSFPYTNGGIPYSIDGILIQHDYFGNTGTAAGSIYNTLTHELGHYLSLYHVWGIEENVCEFNCHPESECETSGDRVCDTPPCKRNSGPSNCDPYYDSCEGCPNWDTTLPYPKENFMSYNNSCQNTFTSDQLTRMYFTLNGSRSNLWTAENRICTGMNKIGEDLHLTIDWEFTTSNLYNNGDVTVVGDFVIESGVTLTVGPGVIIRFCGNAKLVIEPDANLILSGTLTNSCGTPWKGVEVWGDNSQSQYKIGGVRAQGRLVGKPGSVIENATTGVQLWGPDYFNDAGGQISCNGTTFRNNEVAVEFAPYQNFWPYPFPAGSYGQPRVYFANFTTCIFETNNDYIIPAPFHSFLKLNQVNGVRTTACSFTNSQQLSSPSSIDDYGYGIFAQDAGFSVRAKCTDILYPCNNYLHSTFNGLGYGIYTANVVGNQPYLVKQADFSNCFVGVYNSAVSMSTMLFNNFDLGNVPNPSITSDNIGVFFENFTSGMNFEENEFIGSSGNANMLIGTITKGTGYYNNKIRKNTYTDLDIGNLANGQNAVPAVGNRGLVYLCNENAGSSQYDFAVPGSSTLDRIKQSQGLEIEIEPNVYEYDAAGNTFSYTSIDFLNEGNDINYYYNLGGTNIAPLNYSGNFTPIVAPENTCPENYCEPPCKVKEQVALLKLSYTDNKANRKGAEQAYESAVANGNSQQAAQNRIAIDLYQRMMDEDAFMVTIHMMYDTIDYDQDSLLVWMEQLDNFGMDLNLSLYHQSRGNTVLANSFYQKAEQRISLGSEEYADLTNMSTLLQILDGTSPYNLSDTDLESLLSLAQVDESYTGNISRNILTWYGYHFPPRYRLPGQSEEKNSQPYEVSKTKGEKLFVYPNPNQGVFTLLWESPLVTDDIATLHITDVTGKRITTRTITNTELIEIHLTNQRKGIYLYQLISNDRIIQTGKLIVQ